MAAVQDLLTCPICLEWLDVPKRLPCGHVYCLKHLQGLIQEKTGKLKCPECRIHHDVPNGDVNEFPLDYRLECFINPGVMKEGKCKQCKSDKDTSNCDHCDKDLCDDCLKEHKLVLIGSLHCSLKELALNYVGGGIKDDIEQKQVDILKKRERNDKEQKNIKEKCQEIILVVENRRDTLLLPLIEEITILDRQQKGIQQVLKAETIQREMKDELEETDCDVKNMKTLQGKFEEMKTEFDAVLENLKKKEGEPNLVDFNHQTDNLHALIAEYGQSMVHYDNVKVIRTLDGDEVGEKFNKPYGLCVCPHTDHVYLASSEGKSLSEYNQDGHLVQKMKTDFELQGIAVDSKKRLILPDFSGNKVCIYDDQFKLLKSFGSNGTGDGEMNYPLDVVCDDDDNIYVSEIDNHRIHVFTADGDFLRKFGTEVMKRPFFMKITENKRLLVTDNEQDCVCVFTLDGHHVTNIQVDRPCGICLDRNGFILVTDYNNKVIRVFTPEYEPHATIDNQGDIFQDMYGIAITKSGRLFVTDSDNHKLHILQ